MLPKIKAFVKDNASDIMLIIAVILVATLSFSLGIITTKMEAENKEPLQFEQTDI